MGRFLKVLVFAKEKQLRSGNLDP